MFYCGGHNVVNTMFNLKTQKYFDHTEYKADYFHVLLQHRNPRYYEHRYHKRPTYLENSTLIYNQRNLTTGFTV